MERHIFRMGDSQGEIAKRLRKARADRGYENAAEAARALGVPAQTYQGHENGSRGLRREAAQRYASFFGVSVEWLLTGKQGKYHSRKIAVVAYIGAGAEVFPMDDHARGAGLEMVDPPAGLGNDCVAAKIRGDSMHPLRDGWLVFWVKDQDGVPENCLGSLCVVQIKNGPTLLKDLRRGSKPGLYTLESWNAPPREDVEVDWASRIIDIRPR